MNGVPQTVQAPGVRSNVLQAWSSRALSAVAILLLAIARYTPAMSLEIVPITLLTTYLDYGSMTVSQMSSGGKAMATVTRFDNSEDILDTRDLAEVIKTTDDEDELTILKAFEQELTDIFGNMALVDGVTLIRDSYFENYAQELAEDIGAIGHDLQWPLYHIDWEAAANSLKMDYTLVAFDGVEYWGRE